MATITINSQLILDESAGQQDDDSAFASLDQDFRTYLALNFAGITPIESAIQTGMVTVTPDAGETIGSLFFSQPNGSLFTGQQAKEADGTAIQTYDSTGVLRNVYLWSASDPDIVFATTNNDVNAKGEVVAAFYLNDPTNLSASIEMVAYKPLFHEDPSKADEDYLDWGNLLSVTASGTLSFNFNNLESGKFLWVAVGNEDSGLLVTGKDFKVKADGTPINGKNAGDMVNTSQGGDGATIGIDSQMFVPGEAAVFTLVRGLDPLPTETGDATGQDIDLVDYDGYINTGSMTLFISQEQGKSKLDLTMTLLEAGGGTTAEDMGNYGPGLASDTAVPVESVTIKNNLGQTVGTWYFQTTNVPAGQLANGTTQSGVQVTITDNVVDVNGVDAGYQVTANAFAGDTFNRFEMRADTGKFDIGRIDLAQGNNTTKLVGDQVMTDDDGPTVTGTTQILVDEDEMSAAANDGDGSTGITDGDTVTDEASFTDQALAALVGGADRPAVFALNTSVAGGLDGDAVLGTDGLGVTSQGDVVSYNVLSSSVIQGVASDGRIVFELSRNTANDGWEFDLMDQIDHADGSGDTAFRDLDLSPALVVADADLDPGALAANTLTVRVENDVPAAKPNVTATHEVHEDALATGNDGDAGDPEAKVVTATYSNDDLNALVTSGADENLSFSLNTATGGLAAVIGTAVVTTAGTAVESKDLAVMWAAGSVAGTLDGKTSDGRVIFTLAPAATAGSFDFTLKDQVDHLGNGDLELLAIDLTRAFLAEDFDGDAATLNADSIVMNVENDVPFIGSQIADGLVDFAKDSSDGPTSLNGVVGADDDASYVFTSWTNLADFTEILVGDQTNPTAIEYWKDNLKYFDIVLGQAGAGDYTFTVYQDPVEQRKEFDFTYYPSGATMFGVLLDQDDNGQQLFDSGLLVIGQDVVLDAASGGAITGTDTINSSQGGTGPVTIGVNNQMFDAGEGAVFVYLADPDRQSSTTVSKSDGLTAQTANDADTLGFGGTEESFGGSIEVVQRQGSELLGMKLTAYNIDPAGSSDDDIGSAADPIGSITKKNKADDVSQESRTFADNVLDPATTDEVSIVAVQVFDTGAENPKESVTIDKATGAVTTLINDPDVVVTTTDSDNDGIWEAIVQGFNTDDTIAFQTDVKHDAVLVEGFSGAWDVGGFNIELGEDTPDQLLDFSVQITDHDGDAGTGLTAGFEDFSVLIDGTGQFDNDGPDPTALAAQGMMLEQIEPLNVQAAMLVA